MSGSLTRSRVEPEQADEKAEESSPKLEVIPTESYDLIEESAPAGQGGTNRAEASLEATPRGDIVSPATLPESIPNSRSSDSGEESSSSSVSCSPVNSAPNQALTGLSEPSLPGSLDQSVSFRWGPATSRLGTAAQRRTELLMAAPAESSDYLFEEEEIERLSSSPEFFQEQAKDPGFTMLHFVAMLGHRILQDALRNGSSIAVHHRFARIAKCLVWKHKHKLYVKDKYGCTPLQLAAACGNTEMCKVLLEPYAFDTSGREVLDESDSGYKYLNHQDYQMCFSSLHGAVSHSEHETVILLLKHGANPQVLDVTRNTAFKAAPTLASLQELLRLVVQHAEEVPRPVVVQLMAEVLDRQNKENPHNGAHPAGSNQAPAGATAPASGAGGAGKPPGTPAQGTSSGGAGDSNGSPGNAHHSMRIRSSPSQSDLAQLREQRKFKAQQRWSRAAKMLSFRSLSEYHDPGHRFELAAMEMVGHVQNADVGETMKRHFEELYHRERHDVLVEYVITAINSNHHKLTKMMIDLICSDCPDVLAVPKWHETLEPLVSSYPTLFHRLLFKLQGMRDEHVRGFVRCLRPNMFQTMTSNAEELQRPMSGHSGRLMSVPALPPGTAGSLRPVSAAPGHYSTKTVLGSRTHAADRVKLLIYQQLVEGLKKVSYRVVKTFFEESDQRLLNDMAQFPIFADFVGLIAEMQTAKAFDESDSSRRLLLEMLRLSHKAAHPEPLKHEKDSSSHNHRKQGGQTPPPQQQEQLLQTPPRPPALKQSTSGTSTPVSGADGGASLASADGATAAACIDLGQVEAGQPPRPSGSAGLAWPASFNNGSNNDNSAERRLLTKGSTKVSFALEVHTRKCDVLQLEPTPPGAGSRSGSGRLGAANAVAPAPPGAAGTADGGAADSGQGGKDGGKGRLDSTASVASQKQHLDEAIRQRERLSLQTLNVNPVLTAAVKAGKAYNVETAVMNIISWVETNSRDGKAVFLAGITSDLVKELAMRFPSSAATLLNLVSRDVLEQLTTLQVSANVLYGRDHLVKCSHVRNHFTWREHDLRKLQMIKQGYDDHVVDALVDYGVPFECVYKAAMELGSDKDDHATPEQFAFLVEHEFSGPELKQLISNGIRLSKVIAYIEECAKPPPEGVPSDFANQLDVSMAELLRDMLREKLSPRIVDIILREEKMFETTRYNNFRPGRPLRKVYPEPLFFPKYTHHFVQMLLINWQRGVKNAAGQYTVRPWAKEFIDTVLEPNDPLCTKLKSAYDNKLTDTQVYIQGESVETHETESEVFSEQREKQLRQEREAEMMTHLKHTRQLLRMFISNPFFIHRWPVYVAARLYLVVYYYVMTYWQRAEDVYRRWRAKGSGHQVSFAKKARSGTIDAAVLAFPILDFVQPDDGDILTALVHADAPSAWFQFAIVRALYGLHWNQFGRVMILLSAAAQLQFALTFLVFFLLVLNYQPDDYSDDLTWLAGSSVIEGVLCTAAVFSASMLLERVKEAQVPQLGTWVFFGRLLELCCHAMFWVVAILVWSGRGGSLVAALSGLTMLLFVTRMTLYGLVTEKLSTAVLALMEIMNDSRYFFVLIIMVYGGFLLAVAGLLAVDETETFTASLFTILFGDFQSSNLTENQQQWRFATFSLILLSFYAVLMLIVFMNLLIATMNDTYDRVKEFREMEVMRLRSHMMVFVKDFLKKHVKQKLSTLDGDVLHLLLRPEEAKSGRWLAQTGISEPNEQSAWGGRITYMRSTIVREIEGAVREQAEKTGELLNGIEQRIDRLEHKVGSMVSDKLASLEKRLEEMLKSTQEHIAAEHLAAAGGQGGGGGEG